MVLVSNVKKFIYLKNKKVAGTSVEAYFEKYCLPPNEQYKQTHSIDETVSKFGIIGFRENGKQIGNFSNHMNLSDLNTKLERNVINNYFKFCVVRNPYDKMVSYYFFEKKRLPNNFNYTFNEFCKNKDCFNLNRVKLNGSIKCDYFIKFENLLEDLEIVCKKLSIPFDKDLLPNFKSKCRTEKKPYQDYYDEETKQIVYQKHKEEFELFGYTF